MRERGGWEGRGRDERRTWAGLISSALWKALDTLPPDYGYRPSYTRHNRLYIYIYIYL
jgi:hypothetical protein